MCIRDSSLSSPPEEALTLVILVLKAFGETPFGFSITPENTNVLTPLDSGPDVVR